MARPRTISDGEVVQTAFRLDKNQFQQAIQRATDEQISLAELIRRALALYLEENNA